MRHRNQRHDNSHGAAVIKPGSAGGLIERVTYHNAENGFCVLRAEVRGDREIVTVVGHAATIPARELITASGEWVNDRTHGHVQSALLRTSPKIRPTASRSTSRLA